MELRERIAEIVDDDDYHERKGRAHYLGLADAILDIPEIKEAQAEIARLKEELADEHERYSELLDSFPHQE